MCLECCFCSGCCRAALYFGGRYYFGSSTYGWATDTAFSTGISSTSNMLDDYAHMGIVLPTDVSEVKLVGSVIAYSRQEDVVVEVFSGRRPNTNTSNIALTSIGSATARCSLTSLRVHHNVDINVTSGVSLTAGDMLFVGFNRQSQTNATSYVGFTYTLMVTE